MWIIVRGWVEIAISSLYGKGGFLHQVICLCFLGQERLTSIPCHKVTCINKCNFKTIIMLPNTLKQKDTGYIYPPEELQISWVVQHYQNCQFKNKNCPNCPCNIIKLWQEYTIASKLKKKPTRHNNHWHILPSQQQNVPWLPKTVSQYPILLKINVTSIIKYKVQTKQRAAFI